MTRAALFRALALVRAAAEDRTIPFNDEESATLLALVETVERGFLPDGRPGTVSAHGDVWFGLTSDEPSPPMATERPDYFAMLAAHTRETYQPGF